MFFPHRGKNKCLWVAGKCFSTRSPCRHYLIENILFIFQSREDIYFFFKSIYFGFHIASLGISSVHLHNQEDCLFCVCQPDMLKCIWCNGCLLIGTRDGLRTYHSTGKLSYIFPLHLFDCLMTSLLFQLPSWFFGGSFGAPTITLPLIFMTFRKYEGLNSDKALSSVIFVVYNRSNVHVRIVKDMNIAGS